jgi:hypothetical protein
LPRQNGISDVQFDDGADGIAVAVGAGEAELNIIPLGEVIAEVTGIVVEVVDDDVKPAVVGEVGDRGGTGAACGRLAVDGWAPPDRCRPLAARWLRRGRGR